MTLKKYGGAGGVSLLNSGGVDRVPQVDSVGAGRVSLEMSEEAGRVLLVNSGGVGVEPLGLSEGAGRVLLVNSGGVDRCFGGWSVMFQEGGSCWCSGH